MQNAMKLKEQTSIIQTTGVNSKHSKPIVVNCKELWRTQTQRTGTGAANWPGTALNIIKFCIKLSIVKCIEHTIVN